jgi:hypothetical protein
MLEFDDFPRQGILSHMPAGASSARTCLSAERVVNSPDPRYSRGCDELVVSPE